MTTEQAPSSQKTVDWIPEHLPENVKRELVALTEESAGVPSIVVTEAHVRHWCETTEDSNPLYLDEEFAKSQGFSGLVAPIGINMSLTTPYRWPRPQGSGARNLHYTLKKLMNTPTGVVVDTDTFYEKMIEVGDTLVMSNRLASLVGPKKTRIGEGYFWVMEGITRNQRGEVVLRGRTTMFAYNDGKNTDVGENDAPGGLSAATESELDVDRCTHPEEGAQSFWDDVSEGDELPQLLMPITVTRCIFLASATRDFSPHHTNSRYAKEEVHARDMFLNTPFNMGILGRFLTDWGGPQSRVRRIKLYMRDNICAGDDMIIDGKVVKKYEGDDGSPLVDIDIQVSTQDGPAYEAFGTLQIPRSA